MKMQFSNFYLYLVLLVFSIPDKVLGQKEIILDFSTKKFKNNSDKLLEDLKRGDTYQLIIENLNTYDYKVSLDEVDSTISEDTIIDLLGYINLDKVSALVSSLSPLGGIVGALIQDIEETQNDAKETAKSRKARQTILAANAEIDDKLSTFLESKEKEKDEIKKAAAVIDTMILRQQYIHQKTKELKKLIEDMNDRYTSYFSMVELDDRSSLAPVSTSLKVDDIAKDIKALRGQLYDLSQKSLNNLREYTVTIAPFKAIVEKNPAFKAQSDMITLVQAEQSKVFEEMGKLVGPEVYKTMLQSFIRIENNKSNKYTSLPMKFSGDVASLEIKIEPRSEDSRKQSYTTTLEFPVEKEYFWGVSSNIFFSTLYNEAYSSKADIKMPGDTTYYAIKEGYSKWEFGVSAMVNYGKLPATGKKTTWNFGIGLGAAISKKIQPRVLIGGGLAFSENQRFLLNAGLIIGPTDVLSKSVSVGTGYKALPKEFTVNKTKVGVFLSVGYLITRN